MQSFLQKEQLGTPTSCRHGCACRHPPKPKISHRGTGVIIHYLHAYPPIPPPLDNDDHRTGQLSTSVAVTYPSKMSMVDWFLSPCSFCVCVKVCWYILARYLPYTFRTLEHLCITPILHYVFIDIYK